MKALELSPGHEGPGDLPGALNTRDISRVKIQVYCYFIDNFVIRYCQGFSKRNFIMKTETVARKRMVKRGYLSEPKTRDMLKKLYDYLESKVNIPRIKHGKKQSIETLINEESLFLAKFLRD